MLETEVHQTVLFLFIVFFLFGVFLVRNIYVWMAYPHRYARSPTRMLKGSCTEAGRCIVQGGRTPMWLLLCFFSSSGIVVVVDSVPYAKQRVWLVRHQKDSSKNEY